MLSPHLLPTLNNQFLQKLLSSELRFLVSPQKDKTKIKCRKNSAPEAYKGPQHQQYLLLQQPINPTIFERKWAVDLQKTLKGTDEMQTRKASHPSFILVSRGKACRSCFA